MTETYHGKPCLVCGGTERLRSSRGCIRRNNKDHLEVRGALERRRECNREYTTSEKGRARKRKHDRGPRSTATRANYELQRLGAN